MRLKLNHPPPKKDPDANKIKPQNLMLATDPLEIAEFCKLIQCIRTNDRPMIERLMQSGIPHIVDYVHPTEGETALAVAASKNDDSMIGFLLGFGANPNVVDSKGRSAAMRACEMGYVESMQILANAQLDMKIIDEDGKGILFYCLYPTGRHHLCAKIAIEHGADLNNVSVEGTPMFVFACETANSMEDLCMSLLESGSDPKICDVETHRTAVMAAAASGSARVLRGVLDYGGNVNQIMSKGKFHAGHEAAKAGSLECLRILAAFGADFNLQTDPGFSMSLTPMHIIASTKDDPLSCQLLGQRGCNSKLKNKENQTAAQMAKEEGFKLSAKASKKTEKFFKGRSKKPPLWALHLHDFCYYREEAMLKEFQKVDVEGKCTVPKDEFEKILQSFNAPIPEEEEDWNLILEKHTVKKEIDYLLFLQAKKYIQKKFLMNVYEPKKKKEKKGKKKKGKVVAPMGICQLPPLEVPKTRVPQHVQWTDYFRFDRDNPPKHPFADDSAWYMAKPPLTTVTMNDAVRHLDTDTVTNALAMKALRSIIPDKFYVSPLAVAAVTGNLEMVKLLVENGAMVNQKDDFLWQPLHLACHAGMVNVVEYLLTQGARINIPSMNMAMPIMKGIESCSPEIVQLLISKKAEIVVQDRGELTVLEIAALFGDGTVFAMVRKKEESIPPAKNKNKPKPKPKPKKGKNAAPESIIPTAVLKQQAKGLPEIDEDWELPPIRHKPSLMLPAMSLRKNYAIDDDVTYTPRQTWTPMKNTEDLIDDRIRRREEYGWIVDFEDFKMPFLRNIDHKLAAIATEEAKYQKRPSQLIKRPKIV